MSPKARSEPKAEEPQQTMYRIIFKPPEGHDKTFMSTATRTSDETGEDEEYEIEREYLMDMSVLAKSKEAAKLYGEQYAFKLAVQETGSEDPDDVLANQWQIESVEEETSPDEE